MHHPYWLRGDNVICDATPSACAADLRLARPHLAGLMLVAVTCESRGGVQPIQAMPRYAKLATAAAAASLALLLITRRQRILRLFRQTARKIMLLLLANDPNDSFLKRQ